MKTRYSYDGWLTKDLDQYWHTEDCKDPTEDGEDCGQCPACDPESYRHQEF